MNLAQTFAGFLRTIRSGLQSRNAVAALDYSGYTPGVPAYDKWDFKKLAQEGYIENATAYACISEIATAVAGTSWKVERKQSNGKRTRYHQHPLLDLLAAPNKGQSGSEFAEAETSFHLIGGQAYTVMLGKPLAEDKPLTSAPTGLVLARPELVKLVPDAFGLPLRYEIGRPDTSGRTGKVYDPSRVMHWKKFHPNDPVFGLSPMTVAAKDVDTLNAMASFVYRLLRRNGRPEGVLLAEGTLDDEQFKRAKKQVDDEFNNSATAGGWKLFEGKGITVKEFSHKPVDMGLTPMETARILAVCRAFKVPPEIIGVMEAKTYSNYREARKSFYMECVLPLLDSLRDKRNQMLTPLFGEKDHLDYDRDTMEALEEDRKTAWERDSADEAAGRITANEFRAKYGWPLATDPLADQRMVSISRIPADELAGMAEPGNEPPQPTDPEDPDDDEDEDDPDGAQGRTRTQRARLARAAASPLVMVRGLNPTDTWQAFEQRRGMPLLSVRRKVSAQLAADYAVAAKAMRTTGTPGEADRAILDALQAQEPAWQALLNDIYLQVGLDFAASVDAGLAQAFGTQRAKRAKADSWEARIEAYLAKQAGFKISKITDTTRKRVMNTVAAGFKAGLGSDAIAAALTESAPRATAGRALVIARTETLAASNLGSDAAARAFGVPLNKEWLATADGRTRDDHDDANGQAVGLDAPFQVGSASLMFPGDGSLGAGPAEVINCRCVVVYSTID